MDEIKCAKCGEEKNIHKEEIFNKYVYCTCKKCKHKWVKERNNQNTIYLA